MNHFPLESSYLCAELECSAIGNNPQQCPACGNGEVASLQRILDRKPVQRVGVERRVQERMLA